MRTYFLLLFLLCTSLLQAQRAGVVTAQELLKKYRQSAQKPALNQTPVKDSIILHLLPFWRPCTTGCVYRLRDGMPCIVPDTKDIAAMPNAWPAPQKLPYPTTIPNGGKGLFPVLPQPVSQSNLEKTTPDKK
jgi:hypothetical protein